MIEFFFFRSTVLKLLLAHQIKGLRANLLLLAACLCMNFCFEMETLGDGTVGRIPHLKQTTYMCKP